MRILFLSSFLLFPETHFGGSKRLYLFADELRRSHDLTVVCFDGCSEHQHFASVKTPFAQWMDFKGEPPLRDRLAGPYNRKWFIASRRSELTHLLGGQPFDLVIAAFPLALSFFGIPEVTAIPRKIYIEDDLFLEQLSARCHSGPLLHRLKSIARYSQAKEYYRKALPVDAGFVSISDEEAVIVAKRFPARDIMILGYGLNVLECPVVPPPDLGTCGFIGNYNHQPNADAVRFFLERVWPQVLAHESGARVVFAGPGLSKDLVALVAASPGARYAGVVPSVKTFYEQIDVFVNPIVSRRGLRTKLVEAAAFGRPIVTTALGGEGLANLSMHIADDPVAFGRSVVELLESDMSIEAASNRRVVEECYSSAALVEQLLAFASRRETHE